MCILGQESGLKVNHPASFAVRLNGAQGKMEAKVHSPSGALDECVVTELEKGLCSYSMWIFHCPISFFYSQTQLFKAVLNILNIDNVGVKFICPPDKYAIRFIPRENGVHTIDVKFNGSHIPGSPFQVRVGEPGQTGDASLVSAYGAGLERGATGGLQLIYRHCCFNFVFY